MRYLKLKEHPYGACCVIEMFDGYYILVCYRTVVASIYNGQVTRHAKHEWPATSRTTGKHFYAFCRQFDVDPESYKRWGDMEYVEFPFGYDLEAENGKLKYNNATFWTQWRQTHWKPFRISFSSASNEYETISSEESEPVTDADIEYALTVAKFIHSLEGK